LNIHLLKDAKVFTSNDVVDLFKNKHIIDINESNNYDDFSKQTLTDKEIHIVYNTLVKISYRLNFLIDHFYRRETYFKSINYENVVDSDSIINDHKVFIDSLITRLE
jgi:hypothetical protein